MSVFHRAIFSGLVGLTLLALGVTSAQAQRFRPLRPNDGKGTPNQPNLPNSPNQPNQLNSLPQPNLPESEPAPPRIDYDAALRNAVSNWERNLPRQASGFSTLNVSELTRTAQAVEKLAADATQYEQGTPWNELLKIIEQEADLKIRIDARLNELLEQRTQFAAIATQPNGRTAVRNYLRAASSMIDLSGHLRYTMYDLCVDVASDLADKPGPRERFIELLLTKNNSVGAEAAAMVLTDPLPDNPKGIKPVSQDSKVRILQLIGASGQSQLLPEVAKVLRAPNSSPYLLISAVAALGELGLPQDPRPDQDLKKNPPIITAKECHEILSKADVSALDESWRTLHGKLVVWLALRTKEGITGNKLRMNGFDVEPGDWLLMRNPSPYNLFTDISPGLFTHVGVVTAETGSDGIRRFVLVDMPESGKTMPATNVDAFVGRSLHFMFLRHADVAVAKKMSDTAKSVIGNEALFDLNFRTDRVLELKGQPLTGKKINTYCAGFLLLCAQETGLKREAFFPIAEYPTGGNFAKNLKELGMSIGDNFISPTGALFSTEMKLVGRHEPMYDPRRDVEEAVYDHFSLQMERSILTQSPDIKQSLRQKMAEASKQNPLLAKALAEAANVDENLDLVSAAKAAAVVESLDEIAYAASGEFLRAFNAISAGAPKADVLATMTPEQRAGLSAFRNYYSDLCRRWDANEITARELRGALLKQYSQQGISQLDARFFSGKK